MNSYFTLRQVEEGVWAAIAVPGGGAVGNAAIIDLGDLTVVVDTFNLPQAAAYLREAAERLTGKSVKYVVNTHFHGDHHYGNQVFADSTIISTEQTRDFLIQNAPLETSLWQAGLQTQIEGLTEIRNTATELSLITALEYEIADKANLLAATVDIRRVTASLTFTDEFIIHGSERSIRLFTWGGGHTVSDSLVYIPDVKVLVAGDLILSNSHPAMQHGNPGSWIEILDRIGNEIDVKHVIPGHGEVTDRLSIAEMKHYLTNIQAYVEKAIQSGETLEYWLKQSIPAPFDKWMVSHVFEWNFRWLFDRMNIEH